MEHAPRMWGALSKASTKVELSSQDSADLFAYFYAAATWTRGRRRRGKRLFSAKRCIVCHSLEGTDAEGVKSGLQWESLADPIELSRLM